MQSHKPHRQHLTLTLLAIAVAALLQIGAATPAALAAESCPNQGVREQQNAGYLPDCRGYERVSPAQKSGVEVEHLLPGAGEPFQAAVQGAAVAYEADGAFPSSLTSSFLANYYLSYSDSLGSPWQTLPLTPGGALNPQTSGAKGGARVAGEFDYYSPDLSCGVLTTELPLTALPAEESAEEYKENLYVWNAADGSYALVTDAKPQREGTTKVDGASADCSHVIFESEEYESLAPGTEDALFEWDQGTLRVASVLPDGTLAEEPINKDVGRSDLNSISSDGSRVFFTAYADEGVKGLECEEECREVFMRLNGTKTIEISESDTARADENANFQIASKNGEHVFFTANYGLASSSSTGSDEECYPRKGEGCDLYDYDTANGELSDISADENPADEYGAEAVGVLGIAEEGEVVYFSARGQLVPGQGATEEENEEEREANVYAYHDGRLSYVASIGLVEAGAEGETLDAVDSPSRGSTDTVSRVSDDGEYLLFATSRPLRQSDGVTYENIDAGTHKADDEDYEYSLASGAVTCVSCDPSGAQPQLREGPAAEEPFAEEFGQYEESGGGELLRNLANDGAVFFQTTNPMLEQAVNDTVNVYEWEPAGVGSCPAGQTAGCASILDSGSDPGPSYLVGASANGENVYLTTYAKLAPEDTDGLRDVYDVRVNGGFLQTAAKECAGEECQGPLLGQEGTQTPGSTLASGDGNVASTTVTTPVEKPSLTLTSKKVNGSTLKLKVKVSTAGRVTVSGADVSKVGKTATGASTLTLEVKLTKAEAKLAKGKRVKAKLTVAFAPKSGGKLTKKVTASFKLAEK